MATILNIETATSVCSVSIGINGECVALKEINEGRTHAEVLTVFIEDVIKQAGISYKDLDAIAVSSGPGSYTGLRIGVSTAKGLCYALDKPLIAVSTLEAMADGCIMKMANDESDFNKRAGVIFEGEYYEYLFCPMIDARRMEVYAGFYSIATDLRKTISADVIEENSYLEFQMDYHLIFFGDGAEKCKKVFSHRKNISFFDDLLPSANYMVRLSYCKFEGKDFEDLAYFEPFYLKDFVATKAKDKHVG